MMTTKVRFSVPGEFMAELGQAKPNVEPVVRITKQFHDSSLSPNIQHVFVIATAIRQNDKVLTILELKRYTGDYWGKDFDRKALEKADEIQKELEEAAAAMGLEVRAGVYE